MRLLATALVALMLPACNGEEEAEPVCPDLCGDAFTVVAISNASAPLGFAQITVSFVNEEFSFLCDGGRVKQLTDTPYEVSCDDESFTVEGIAPVEIDVDLNGLYQDTLSPAYTSAHPSLDCDDYCRQAEVEWQLPV
jgi:hypothetical protein